MESVHSAMPVPADRPASAERGVRRPPRFEREATARWVAVIPLVMAGTIAVVWWMDALAHAR